MSWSISFTAKTMAEAKEKLSAATMQEGDEHPVKVPPLVSQYMSMGISLLGEPADGKTIAVSGHGHEFRPGWAADVNATFNIIHVPAE